MNKRMTHAACTSILVGKDATIDGSTIIARNEDNYVAIAPKRLIIRAAKDYHSEYFVSANNGFRWLLNGPALRYTATPDRDASAGLYEESGINGHNVAMSATESAYANNQVLAADPLVGNGIAEDAMVSVVLPFVKSARAGVERLGQIVTQSGAAETNGVLFSDASEVWYMEIATGHQWVAQRIPSNAYAVVANQLAIQEINFADQENFITAPGLQDFVVLNHLNPRPATFNFRVIFGTQTQEDVHYNSPRVWEGQRVLTPTVIQQPEVTDLPFVQYPDQRLSLADIQRVLRSHYNGTRYDPLGTTGDQNSREKYRAISLSRTQNSHILQIRADKPEALAAIQWVAFGISAFSPYVPFYSNSTVIPQAYAQTPAKVTLSSAYWLYRVLAVLVEPHYLKLAPTVVDFLTECERIALQHVTATDHLSELLPDNVISTVLTQANTEMTQQFMTKTQAFLGELVIKNSALSKLTFAMDKNL